MRGQCPDEAADELRSDVRACFTPWDFLPGGHHHRDGRIEMRARDRAQHGDQHEQDSAGRQRVGEQRDRDNPAGKRLGHDPGTDHAGEQEEGADALRR